MNKHKEYGFTIVELLIVIVVIAILASITVTAFNGVQNRADKSARGSELLAWKKLFQSYKASYGAYPAAADGGYCLGSGASNGYCRNYLYAGAYRYAEADSTTLMTELKKISSLPSGTRKPIEDTVGPYVLYYANGIVLQQVFRGSSSTECPQGTAYAYLAAPLLICDITLND